MKKMIVDSIKQLKQQKQDKKVNNQLLISKQQQKMDYSPKRQSQSFDENDYKHRHSNRKSKDKLFDGLVFCFPIIDLELTPKQIQLMSISIQKQGGKVVKYFGKLINQTIDFVAINPKLQIENVRTKIQGKISYKEIIDYHFINNSLRSNYLENVQKYSLYINVQELQIEAKGEKGRNTPSKKIKKEEEIDSDNTVKLSDEDQPQKYGSQIKVERLSHQQHEKVDIQQLMLHQKAKENNFSMNKFIADELTKLMKIYATERDFGRKVAYMKAASVIRGLDRQIQSEKDVENLRGIGDKISKKIKQLLETGKINKLETLQHSEKNIARGKLSQVWGIGPSKANQLYNIGIKTIEDLQKRTDLLNKNQKIGLKYFDDFQKKIPRQKVNKMFQFVRNVVETMVVSIDMYCIEICGSYRRGRAECGDIDIIISRKDGVFEKNFVVDLVRQLQNVRFLTDHLTHPKPGQGRSSMSYMGVCQFQDKIHHRIDIKYYPIEEYAFAILHFTGNSTFNRMLRFHTMKLGLQLSDKGAFPKMEKGVIWDKHIPKCYTEQDIFKFLGLDYKTPLERDI